MVQAVIGLEVHAQLDTASKLFCPCPVDDEAPPNTVVCPVCLGHPGTLPSPNAAAVERAVRAALALGATVHPRSRFDRKQYFYPDLPKGYQITQHAHPLATGGALHLGEGVVRLTRLHLEEDAGRSQHHRDWTGVDYNRAGVPLIEVVTEPDLRSPAEAEAALRLLHRVLVEAGVTRGELQRGHLRCDANVSVHRPGDPLGERVEIKNVNSFRYVARALEAEIARQTAVLARGGSVERETRSWRDGTTVPLRDKEQTADYRYLPDPDLPPLYLGDDLVARARAALPGAPLDRWLAERDAEALARLVAAYDLDPAMARVFMERPVVRDLYEAAVEAGGDPEQMGKWVAGDVLRRLNEGDDPDEARLRPEALVELEEMVADGTLSRGLAREVFDALWEHGGAPREVARHRGLRQVSDPESLRAVVARVLAAHPGEVARFRAGNARLVGFFMGRVMEATGGRADPVLARHLVEEALSRV